MSNNTQTTKRNNWFNTLNKRWNIEESITENMLRLYVKKNFINAKEFEEITKIKY